MKRVLSSVAVVMLALSGLTALGTATASAAPVPAVVIATPSAALANNGVVAVTGTGFAASTAYDIVECVAGATSLIGCNTSNLVAVTTSISGAIASTNYTVTTGAIGNGTCGTASINDTCQLDVVTTTYMPVLLVSFTTITFGSGRSVTLTPDTGLVNGTVVAVTGSGFTAGDSLYILECPKNTVSLADCATDDAVAMTVGPTGVLTPGKFKIIGGHVGSGTCGTGEADLNGCYLTVSTTTSTDQGYSPLVFAAPKSPTASKATGSATPGKASTLTITGKNFTSGVTVLPSAGVTATVTSATSTSIKVSVKAAKSVAAGAHDLTLEFAGGNATAVSYTVK
jgi:Neocarzinostatin family